MTSIEKVIQQWQQEQLSPICLNECDNTCCSGRGQKIEITPTQALRIFNVSRLQDLPLESDEHEDARLTKHYNENYVMGTWQSKEFPCCKMYNPKTKFCKIEDDKPTLCRSYPLFIEDKNIQFSLGCYASQNEQVIDTLKKEVRPLGFKVNWS